MPIPYKVKVTVKSVAKGECPLGFKAGDQWFIESAKTPDGMCPSAYNSVAPAIRVFRMGGKHPWDKNKDVTQISCPDPEHWVTYEVRRLR